MSRPKEILAKCMNVGQGVAQDYVAAYKWLKLAQLRETTRTPKMN